MKDEVFHSQETPQVGVAPASAPTTAPTGTSLVVIPSQTKPAARRRWWLPFALSAIVLGCGGGIACWWFTRPPSLPPGIAFSNGRLEADEVDVDTKFSGLVSEILVDEGSMVKTGQVVARIDTSDLQQELFQARAQTDQATQMVVQDEADLVQMGSQLRLADDELQRARTLTGEGFQTQEVLDERQSQFNVAFAGYRDMQAKVADATAGVAAATHGAGLIEVNINDDTLVAPQDGPIEYRLTNVGAVLPAGGKAFTMLDVTYVYMDIFLPTRSAGRVKIGDDASIVLDALPTRPIHATVTFLAAGNEFTPKTVETQEERDKLMFRVRVRIAPALLRAHEAEVRSGLPGLAYIRLDKTPWPAALQPVIVR